MKQNDKTQVKTKKNKSIYNSGLKASQKKKDFKAGFESVQVCGGPVKGQFTPQFRSSHREGSGPQDSWKRSFSRPQRCSGSVQS